MSRPPQRHWLPSSVAMINPDALIVRDRAVRFMEYVANDDPDSYYPVPPEERATFTYWFDRQCLWLSQVISTACHEEFKTEVVCGVLVGPKVKGRYVKSWQHAWIELPDRTIIDPTSKQYEMPERVLVVSPGDELYRHYRMRGWWSETR